MNKAYHYKHNPIVKKIFFAMLVPTIFMNLTTSIASMADTMIIGRYLDDASLSVVTFATPIYMIMNVFSALFAVGGCICMSIDAGKGQRDAANKAFSISIELLALIGILMVFAGLFFCQGITRLLGAGEDVFPLVQDYARIILLGAPFLTLNTGLAFFVRNDGRPTLSMIGMLSSIVVDISLNFVFVGYMGLGVAGAAYSTVLGAMASLVILCSHFLSAKNTLKFHFAFDATVLRIFRNGGSTALQFVYQFATILIMNHLLANLAGTNGVVLYTVVFNLATVALSLFEGISQTIQPMVSCYYGEKSHPNIRETMRLAFLAILVICGTVTVLLEAAPQTIPTVFGIETPELIAKAAVAVRIYALSMVITTVNVVIGNYLQSIEQNVIAAILVSLRSFVLFLSAALLLGKMFGINGIWAAYIVAEVLTFVILLIMLRSKQEKLKNKGIQVDAFLLNVELEDGLRCLTCDCSQHDFDAFVQEVNASLPVGAYLELLGKSISKKAGEFVEVEFNKCENKILVRDNLKHDDFSHAIRNAGFLDTEYAPILGWNRLSLKLEGK